jgi:hypothetical protein
MKTAIIAGGTRGIGLGIASAAQLTQERIEKEYGVKVVCKSTVKHYLSSHQRIIASLFERFV